MERFGFPDKTQDAEQAQGLVLSILPCNARFKWDLKNNQNAQITMTQSMIFDMPVGIKYGRLYCIELIQEGAGSFTVTWNGAFKNISTLTLATAAGSSNFLTFKAIGDTTLGLVGNYSSTRA